MSTDEKPYVIIQKWWREAIGADTGAARALAARLRRASGPVEILAHEAVVELADRLDLRTDPRRLTLIAGTVAHVSEHDHDPSSRLARRLGAGEKPAMSKPRFERLLRSTDAELTTNMRRAIAMVGGKCDVGALGKDLLFWNDKTRVRWCFEYFGETAP